MIQNAPEFGLKYFVNLSVVSDARAILDTFGWGKSIRSCKEMRRKMGNGYIAMHGSLGVEANF